MFGGSCGHFRSIFFFCCGLWFACLFVFFFEKEKREVRRTREEKAKRESRRREVERGREEVCQKAVVLLLSLVRARCRWVESPPPTRASSHHRFQFLLLFEGNIDQGPSRATGEQQRATARAETGAQVFGYRFWAAPPAGGRQTPLKEKKPRRRPRTRLSPSHKTFDRRSQVRTHSASARGEATRKERLYSHSESTR